MKTVHIAVLPFPLTGYVFLIDKDGSFKKLLLKNESWSFFKKYELADKEVGLIYFSCYAVKLFFLPTKLNFTYIYWISRLGSIPEFVKAYKTCT